MQVEEFLTPKEHRELLSSVLNTHRPHVGSNGHAVGPSPDQVPQELAECIAERLRLVLPQVLPEFDVSRRFAANDFQLRAEGSEDCLPIALGSESAEQTVACHYFFYRTPTKLSGGELRFRSGEDLHLVEPRNNAMLIFPSSALSESLPLRCQDGDPTECRFALSLLIP